MGKKVTKPSTTPRARKVTRQMRWNVFRQTGQWITATKPSGRGERLELEPVLEALKRV